MYSFAPTIETTVTKIKAFLTFYFRGTAINIETKRTPTIFPIDEVET